MVKDMNYDLEPHPQRIDEKMTQLTTEHQTSRDVGVDLNDENGWGG